VFYKKINKINLKYIRIHVYDYTEQMFASNLPHRDRKPKYIRNFKQNMAQWPLTPFPFLAPCALAFPRPSHRDATMPSPCWAPHFMTQERIVFSNSTLNKQRLSPATTMSDDMLSALTPPLHCASILQPATPPQDVAFES